MYIEYVTTCVLNMYNYMYIEYVTIHVHRVCNYMYIVDICKNMNKVKYMKLFIKINALISHGQQTCSWSSDRQHLYPE